MRDWSWPEWLATCIVLSVGCFFAATIFDAWNAGEDMAFCIEGLSPRGVFAHAWVTDSGAEGLIMARFSVVEAREGPCPKDPLGASEDSE